MENGKLTVSNMVKPFVFGICRGEKVIKSQRNQLRLRGLTKVVKPSRKPTHEATGPSPYDSVSMLVALCFAIGCVFENFWLQFRSVNLKNLEMKSTGLRCIEGYNIL